MTWQLEDEADFKLKARENGNRMHGVYNLQDKIEFQQNILGTMTMAMRGYIIGMVERRWGKNKYSLALQKDVEGSELTFYKALSYYFSGENANFTLGKLLEINFLPTIRSAYTKDVMRQLGFSDNQYYNMRRHFADWFIIWLTTALTGGMFGLAGQHGLLGKGSDDDPDDFFPENEDDYPIALAYYFVARLGMESAAYNDIFSFTKREAPATLTLFGSNISMVSSLIDIFVDMITQDEYQKGAYKGEKKWWVKYQKQGLGHINPLYPYFRFMYTVGQDPRKAAQSFEINRGNAGR